MSEVKFQSHRHPLTGPMLLSEEGSEVCGLCGKEVKGPAYVCSTCNFNAHVDCAEGPPISVKTDKCKIHEHTLTLLPRHVSFTCNACGLSGDKSPFVCLSCCFMINDDCLDVQANIKISRHEHRLSQTCFLGPQGWICGVCRQSIDGKYGGYVCVKSCSYAVHLKCATRKDVWDGKEPEEVMASNISHFSHPHILRLDENEDIENGVCSVCAFPVSTSPFYRCPECDIFLHFKCATLPRKIFMFLHVHPLTLCTKDLSSSGSNVLSRCDACNLHFNGFSYRCLLCNVEFDIRCSTLVEPFKFHLQPNHDLFFNVGTESICNVCDQPSLGYMLTSIKCNFSICFACATLPNKASYKYDEHELSLTIGEDVSTNPYWCDICENKIEDKNSHYKCSDCGPVLHTECVLGSFRNMRPWFSFITQEGHEYEVIVNDRTSLLRCSHCLKDCHEPLLLMSTTTTSTTYLCSSTCLRL